MLLCQGAYVVFFFNGPGSAKEAIDSFDKEMGMVRQFGHCDFSNVSKTIS